VLGIIDGTHVELKAPSIDEPNYVNRHGRHSLNVQGICAADLRLLNVLVQWPGSTHDSFIWRHSHIKQRLDEGLITGWLLGIPKLRNVTPYN
jgi:nuclease HARBI1